MRKLSITVEVTRSYCEEVEISDEQYAAFVNGDIDEFQIPEIDLADMFNVCRHDDDCNEHSDYSIVDDRNVTIVDWK